MRTMMFLLGVSLSALTCAYGADVVNLQITSGGTSYPYISINDALTTGVSAHTTTTPILTLTTATDTVEATSTDLTNFTGGVSITGASSGTTITGSSTSSGSSLFRGTIPNTINFQNISFSSFVNSTGSGIITMPAGGALAYTADSGFTSVLTPATAGAAHDTDIASNGTATFAKGGAGTLTLNTVNANWLGGTTINAGSLIVGDRSHTTAQWGSADTQGTITLTSGTFGGYGKTYAPTIDLSGGTWLLGLTPSTATQARLNLTGKLTLPTNIEIDGLLLGTSFTFPTGGYTVATGSWRLH
ncbi:hypothetical protein [Candidatus Finniella inopinata]|uniref:Autotransporter outer membrane beta-barrel domain-containing protein n=1 Tax=Candidatus Finniella inopinata TaxID=1696036 RepID=A0A4Q7DI21_9PROT|nr:hypothetical protein [Candidatus Finniella inopinata]RZI45715.1 hypothetical protein EQU50_06340 [Candidatus Finniella inopinata]